MGSLGGGMSDKVSSMGGGGTGGMPWAGSGNYGYGSLPSGGMDRKGKYSDGGGGGLQDFIL